MKVVAAMSGGVDSAVAAARAAEAGHEVTGVHLALSRNPASYRSGARGCCTIEDSNDARRAADVIGIPFYVWDLSERFHEDVVEDFMDEYAAGRTPNPCLRCNEKIKFAAVLDRALALGFDAVATGHYAQLRTGADGLIEMHRAADHGKDQSYVLGVLDQQQLRHSMFPLGDTDKPAVRREAEARGLLVADKPDSPRHLLRRRRRQRRLAAREARRPRPQPRRRHRRRHHGRDGRQPHRHLRLHHRPAPRAAARHPGPGRQAPLRARHRAGQRDGHRRSARAARGRPDRRHPAALVRHRARAASTAPCSCAPTAPSTGRRSSSTGDRVSIDLLDPAEGIAPGQAAVIYDGTRVVGSATIESTRPVGVG